MHHLTLFKKNWHYLVGIIVFAFILSKIDIQQTMSFILTIKKPYFIASALLSIPIFFVRALRWRYLMLRQGIKYSVKSAVSMYFSSLFIGLATPGRVGELAKLQYLRNNGHSFGKSLFGVFFDRVFDGIFLTTFMVIGLLAFWNIFGPISILYPTLITFAIFLSLFLVYYSQKKLIKKVLISLFKFLIPRRYKALLKPSLIDFFKDIKIFNASTILTAAFFTLIAVLTYYAQAYLLTIALGFSIDLFYLIFAVSLASFASLLPISIFGIGTRDVTLLTLFLYVGISKELSIAFSILVLANILLLALFCSAFWFKNPTPLTPKKPVV